MTSSTLCNAWHSEDVFLWTLSISTQQRNSFLHSHPVHYKNDHAPLLGVKLFLSVFYIFLPTSNTLHVSSNLHCTLILAQFKGDLNWTRWKGKWIVLNPVRALEEKLIMFFWHMSWFSIHTNSFSLQKLVRFRIYPSTHAIMVQYCIRTI